MRPLLPGLCFFLILSVALGAHSALCAPRIVLLPPSDEEVNISLTDEDRFNGSIVVLAQTSTSSSISIIQRLAGPSGVKAVTDYVETDSAPAAEILDIGLSWSEPVPFRMQGTPARRFLVSNQQPGGGACARFLDREEVDRLFNALKRKLPTLTEDQFCEAFSGLLQGAFFLGVDNSKIELLPDESVGIVSVNSCAPRPVVVRTTLDLSEVPAEAFTSHQVLNLRLYFRSFRGYKGATLKPSSQGWEGSGAALYISGAVFSVFQNQNYSTPGSDLFTIRRYDASGALLSKRVLRTRPYIVSTPQHSIINVRKFLVGGKKKAVFELSNPLSPGVYSRCVPLRRVRMCWDKYSNPGACPSR